MEDNKERLQRLLQTEKWCTEDEQWMRLHLNGEDPAELRLLALEQYSTDLTEQAEILDKKDSKEILHSIHRRIGVSRQVKVRRWDWLLTLAASLLLILGAGYFINRRAAEKAAEIHYVQIRAARGEVKLVKLEDGSRVWLNAESRLSFPDKFVGRTREVSLWGEAYFEVAHRKAQPFLIHTEGLVTQVLGTSFNIKAYHDEKNIEVAVVSGKVGVTVKGEPGKLIMPNQQVVYNKSRKLLTQVTPLDAAARTSWKEGRLQFRDTALPEVIAELERKYNVSIAIDSNLTDCTVYANFNNEPIAKVLKLLGASTNARISAEGNGYRLQGPGCTGTTE